METKTPARRLYSPLWLLLTALLITAVTLLGPSERTLGGNLRLVILHGAWVWTGKIAFAAAALAGLVGLVIPRRVWQNATLALGRTGLVFWLTYLPMSLLVQQLNWGGIFWDEPRWRIPFSLGVAALLLQIALWVMKSPRLTCAANLIFGAVLWWQLGGITNVLHPDSPIAGSESAAIQLNFVILLGLSLLAAAQIAWSFYSSVRKHD